jgi:hypothetical protein
VSRERGGIHGNSAFLSFQQGFADLLRIIRRKSVHQKRGKTHDDRALALGILTSSRFGVRGREKRMGDQLLEGQHRYRRVARETRRRGEGSDIDWFGRDAEPQELPACVLMERPNDKAGYYQSSDPYAVVRSRRLLPRGGAAAGTPTA